MKIIKRNILLFILLMNGLQAGNQQQLDPEQDQDESDIVQVFKEPSLSQKYSKKALMLAGTVALAAIAGGSYLLLDHYDDDLHQMWKDLTNPTDYQSFEKKHGLESDGMNEKERARRFQEWQRREQKSQSIKERAKEKAAQLQEKRDEVTKFEKKHRLLSEGMTEQERMQRLKEFKKGEEQIQDMKEALEPVAKFEKEQGLEVEGLSEKYRIQRFEEWTEGDEHEKLMRAVKRWEEQNPWTREKRNRYVHEPSFYHSPEFKFRNSLNESIKGLHKQSVNAINNHDLTEYRRIKDLIASKQAERDTLRNKFNERVKADEGKTWGYIPVSDEDLHDENKRIEQYMDRTDPVQRWFFENENIGNLEKLIKKF